MARAHLISAAVALALTWALVPPLAAQEAPHRFDVFEDEEEEEEEEEEEAELPEGELPEGDAPEEPGEPVKPEPEAPVLELAEPEPEPEPEPASTAAAEPAAKGPSILALVLPDAPEGASLAARLGDALAVRLARKLDGRVITAARALDPERDEAIAAELDAARAAAGRGETAFDDLDLEVAETELSAAVQGFLPHTAILDADDRASLEQSLLLLGVRALYDGDGEEADRRLVALAQLAPGYTPDENRHPSNVIDRWRAVRDRIETRSTGTLELRSEPPGASIWIDGVFRGATPLEVSGLADGRHVVILDRLGSRPHAELALVSGGGSERLEVDLEPSPAQARLDAISPRAAGVPSEALDVGRSLGVDRLLLLRLGTARGTVEGLWLDVGSGTVLARLTPEPAGEDTELAADALLSRLAASEEAERLLAAQPPAPVAEPLVERWWFWAAVGGAALATAAVITFAVADGGGGPPSSGFILGF